VAAKTKARTQQLASDIRRSNSEAAIAIKELLPLLIAQAKDSLVDAEGLELTRLQGKVRGLSELLTMVTREPPSITREGV
jgi:hypothetical protein